MKKYRINFILAVVILLCFTSMSAFAGDSTTYDLKDLHMTIDIPDNMLTFTRDIDASEHDLTELGMQEEELLAYYKEMNIYLNAMSQDYGSEIVVTMLENDGSQEMFDINEYDDSQLEKIAALLPETQEVKSSLIEYTGSSIYKQENTKFIVMDFEQKVRGVKAYGCQYYTVYNGQAINVTLHSYGQEISAEQRDLLTSIVDSISFTETFNNPSGKGGSLGLIIAIILVIVLGACLIFYLRNKGGEVDHTDEPLDLLDAEKEMPLLEQEEIEELKTMEDQNREIAADKEIIDSEETERRNDTDEK